MMMGLFQELRKFFTIIKKTKANLVSWARVKYSWPDRIPQKETKIWGMLFNSFEFLLFLPTVFLLYWFVFNKNGIRQNLLLLVASYFFYGWWSWKFLLLLILSTLLDYLYGFGVASGNKKKAKIFLWLSIVNNLGILGIFKYYNFFAT